MNRTKRHMQASFVSPRWAPGGKRKLVHHSTLHPKRDCPIRHVSYAEFVPATTTAAHSSNMSGIRKDYLISAKYVPPATLELQFADASFLLQVERIGIPLECVKWHTAKASSNGDAMAVVATKGEIIPVESSTLRYLADQDYAAEIEATLKSLQFAPDELSKLKEQAKRRSAPAAWANEPERDSRLESWK